LCGSCSFDGDEAGSSTYHGWVITPTNDGCHVLTEETQQGPFHSGTGNSYVLDERTRSKRQAFNHLPATQLGTNPVVKVGQQVVFVSSDDADASASIAALATQLGFAPIELDRLDQGCAPLHVLGRRPVGLLSQTLVTLG
jgi:predicted dinucleotide-binding enzyme